MNNSRITANFLIHHIFKSMKGYLEFLRIELIIFFFIQWQNPGPFGGCVGMPRLFIRQACSSNRRLASILSIASSWLHNFSAVALTRGKIRCKIFTSSTYSDHMHASPPITSDCCRSSPGKSLASHAVPFDWNDLINLVFHFVVLFTIVLFWISIQFDRRKGEAVWLAFVFILLTIKLLPIATISQVTQIPARRQ